MSTPQFHLRLVVAVLFGVVSGVSRVDAQTAAQVVATDADVSRAEMMRPITNQLFRSDPDYAPPSPSDDDLGEQRLLVPDSRYKSLTLFFNTSEFYTSNATLTNGGNHGDWLTTMQFGAAWVPRIKGSLYGEVTALQQLYRYADLSSLSFNSLDLGAGIIYVFRDLEDLAFFARYNYNLLTSPTADQSIFYQQTIRLGLQKPFNFTRAQSATLGLFTDLNLDGWPDYAVRNRFALMGGYQAYLTRSLQLNLLYQLGYFPFAESTRQDLNQILSAALTYNFSPRFSVSLSVSGAFNQSNESFYTYNVLNTGGGVSANLKF